MRNTVPNPAGRPASSGVYDGRFADPARAPQQNDPWRSGSHDRENVGKPRHFPVAADQSACGHHRATSFPPV